MIKVKTSKNKKKILCEMLQIVLTLAAVHWLTLNLISFYGIAEIRVVNLSYYRLSHKQMCAAA